MKGPALLLLNGEPPSLELLEKYRSKAAFFLAADGAANWLCEQQIYPDVILGDFDSITKESKQFFTETPQIHRENQDQTDAEKAIRFLQEEGFQEFFILGGLGKRQDHLLYHYSLLLTFQELKIQLIGEEDSSFLAFGKVCLEEQKGTTLSLIPAFGKAKVSSKGLAWELSDSTLQMGGLVSCSNQIKEKTVTLEIQENPILIVISHHCS